MTPCILIAYNTFSGETCCLHARAENPGTTNLHAYEITAPESVVGKFDDTSEWDIMAVIELGNFKLSTADVLASMRGDDYNLRIHIDEIDVTEGSAPEEDE